MTQRITIARGDGIGPEIMDAVLHILNAAGAGLKMDEIRVGESVYRQGIQAGIEPESWDVIRRNRVLLKAPITTPQSGGVKSLNVTLRKTLGLYANVRPCRAYHPFVRTKHPGMDVVIVRENEEDTYGGIEHQQTYEVVQCLKLITAPGSERIIRYAFEYARRNQRRKVTCFVKDNIMKLTDGLFHSMFRRVAEEYPDIVSESMIVDIGTARLADTPEWFDVVVMPNLYGDIVSDVAAQIAGSVGLAGSANIGRECAMFEAIHGSAPDIAGKGIANPGGLLMAAVMMLVHIGKPRVAERIHNAFLRTMEEGDLTEDMYSPEFGGRKLGTMEFAEGIVARLGLRPEQLEAVEYPDSAEPMQVDLVYSRRERVDAGSTRVVGGAGDAGRSGDAERPGNAGNAGNGREKPIGLALRGSRSLVGVDVFVFDQLRGAEALAECLQSSAGELFSLRMITNRGTKVWPGGVPETFCTDHWRCRFRFLPQSGEEAVGEHGSSYAPGVSGSNGFATTAEATETVTETDVATMSQTIYNPLEIYRLLARIQESGIDVIKTEHLYEFGGEPAFSRGQGE